MIKTPKVTPKVESAPRERPKVDPTKFKKLMEKKEREEGVVAPISPIELMASQSARVEAIEAVGLIDEVYEMLCEKMVHMETNGIERLEVHYRALSAESALCDLTFTIDLYDTAPQEWNITFTGSPQGVELLSGEMGNLQQRLSAQFENHVVRIASPELLAQIDEKDRFGKRTTLLSSEKNQDRRWKRIQAAGSATSQR